MSVGVGIICLSASGGLGGPHLPALAAAAGYEVRPLSASSPASTKAGREKYGMPLAVGNAEELVWRDEVDLVVVIVKVLN